MLINLTERDACLLVHLEERLAANGVSVRKIAGQKEKKSDLFLFCKEIDNWWLVGGAAPCHGEIHIQIVTRLSPKVHSLPQDQYAQSTQS